MSFWPLHDLRIHCADLELRLGTLDDLEALAQLAFDGIHPPEEMPFSAAWTDETPEKRALSTIQVHWRSFGEWTAEHWNANFVVFRDGVVVGTQHVNAKDFAIRKLVSTGSWLGAAYQGQGIGTAMRAAVLHLAFEGLNADYARSSAYFDNPSSLGVSRRLGYTDNGIGINAVRGQSKRIQELLLTREQWRATDRPAVEMSGLEPCLALFGAAPGRRR